MSLSEAEEEIVKLRVQLAVLRQTLAFVINATLSDDDRTRILAWLDAKPTGQWEDRMSFHEFLCAKDSLMEAIYTDALGRNQPDS